jgi:hypothetical protein
VSVDEWDQRQPCSDGACIGLIGADGLCKVCGRAAQNWGDERKRGQLDAAADAEDDDDDLDDEDDDDDVDASETDDAYDEDDDDDDDDEDDEDDAEDDTAIATAHDADSDAPDDGGKSWSKRKLCSNGACIGVIGGNGKCTVCGSPP